MLHIPLLRHGQPYKSLDVVRIPHHRTREPFVEVSQANTGLIRRDLRPESQAAARRALAAVRVTRLIEMCGEAAGRFLEDRLSVGDHTQSPQDYVEQVSATTGMPFVMVRRNMQKIAGVLARMADVLAGLTRRLDPGVLDAGFGEAGGQMVSYFPRAEALGVVLPSNSPGVHSLWLPAVPLKIPLVLKPGSAEPWTPYRVAQAFGRSGCPPAAFSYYPAGHAGAAEIVGRCGRSMFFGDTASVGAWQGDPRVELHGPGFSKIVIGEDRIDRWEEYLDLMVASILENGGRSCVNASGVWVPARARDIAEALADRLAAVTPRAADDERAELAPFADPVVAARISDQIEAGLREPGARDVTADHRSRRRLVEWQGCTYLLPTIVLCDRPDHALANREFLFPYASVTQVSQQALPECLGRTLVVTAITADHRLVDRLVTSPLVDRLNLGAIPTNRISWDQPHEGNLFEHLYGRRAMEKDVQLVIG